MPLMAWRKPFSCTCQRSLAETIRSPANRATADIFGRREALGGCCIVARTRRFRIDLAGEFLSNRPGKPSCATIQADRRNPIRENANRRTPTRAARYYSRRHIGKNVFCDLCWGCGSQVFSGIGRDRFSLVGAAPLKRFEP
jgi:hypothetical protein